MEIFRKVIDSELLLNIMDIPECLRHQKVEILIRPLGNETSEKKRPLVRGMLENYKNPELLDQEAKAWSEAVREKYEDN